jgi:hypothetical protein
MPFEIALSLGGDAVFPPGTEVARFRLPVSATALVKMVPRLEKAYGKGLRIKPEDDWWTVLTPTEDQVRLDVEHEQQRALRES